ncbi:HlyD family efflux transporter periplasmic adaptor subunit [Laspinema olomoucense]|uniref:HlyD family efflux transporter periplasmic adaptor subunit n=1 Tax=Laspinema olomoucense TaxID=3231600 RepID=UPI0021BB4ED0|nr:MULTISPECIES: HlyD family efflux transporter periplasmic adaptor subunit [unclassified Laspinema]MCT7973679.1 HlyD family efflux transporter periplasmic adaptor subunit [Laspinema sp. D3d]MCT7996274.1 HlyD family efflux transporter periplasmic adaptor subunit [Laspinema sp. D3c]
MTTTNNQPQKSPLKVVPPKSIAQPQTVVAPVATLTSAAASPAKAPTASKSYGKWLMMLILVGGGVAISRLSIINYVRGEGEITSRTDERHRILMPMSGIVKLKVGSNEPVKAGDVVAEVFSQEIEGQIAEAERSLQQANASQSMAEERLKVAEKELDGAKLAVTMAQRRADKQQQEIQAIISGEKQPRIREIEQEIKSIESEIDAIKNVILGLESQIGGVQTEISAIELSRLSSQEILELQQGKIARFQPLIEEKALALEHFEEAKKEEIRLRSQVDQLTSQMEVKQLQIDQLQSSIHERGNLIEQKSRAIAAKLEQIKAVEKQVEDLRDERDNDVEQYTAAQGSAETKVAAAFSEVENETKRVAKAELELQRVRAIQGDLIVTTKTSGIILDADLDLRHNTPLSVGQELMTVVDLAQLTAELQIPQEDRNLIDLGQTVIFKLAEPNSIPYKATVEDIRPLITPDVSGAKRILTVIILIDNHDKQLRPGSKGFAHIETGEMRVYQKVQHELNKVFNLDKYFVGFSKN